MSRAEELILSTDQQHLRTIQAMLRVFTPATPILDPDLRSRSLVRVLKPGGAVLWCDFVYNNPFNPNVRGIRKRRWTRSSEMGVPAPDARPSACMARTTGEVGSTGAARDSR